MTVHVLDSSDDQFVPRAQVRHPSGRQPSPTDLALGESRTCVGCEGTWEPPAPEAGWQGRWFFCSAICSEKAKYVRYVRKASAKGTIEDPEVQEAINMRLSWIVQGGYLARDRTVSPVIRMVVVERAGGLCESCGKPGTDIDHIEGDNGELTNLQLLCSECHKTKTDAASEPYLATSEDLIVVAALKRRIDSTVALFPADDEQKWDRRWRAIYTARRRIAATSP